MFTIGEELIVVRIIPGSVRFVLVAVEVLNK